MTTPARYALDLYRGDTFALAVRLWADSEHTLPSDLTGATAAAQLRGYLTDTLLVELDATIALPNVVNLRIEAGDWPDEVPELALWDLELTYPSGTVRTILAGPARVLDDVTVAV